MISNYEAVTLMDTRYNFLNSPGVEQLGSFENVNCVCVMHVTMLLPVLRAPGSEHFTSTTVPPVTGNVVVVAIVFLHSTFSPVQPVALINIFQQRFKYYHLN